MDWTQPLPTKKVAIGGNRFGLFVWSWDNGYFRIFGHGLSVEPLKGHQPLFIERNGLNKAWHVLGHCVRLLH